MRQLRAPNIIPMVRNLGLFFTVILAVVIAIFAAQYPNTEEPYVPALSSDFYYEKGKYAMEELAGRIDNRVLKAIINTSLPVMTPPTQGSSLLPDYKHLFRSCLNLLSGVKLDDPVTYLKSQIPMMVMVPVVPVTAESYEESEIDNITDPPGIADVSPQQVPVNNKITSDIPLIALYNTHTSETYEPDDGVTHVKGKAGGVAIVAREIEKTINEKYKIAVTYTPTLHDLSFNKSYIESEKTVKQILRDNPKLEMVFDIHRDGSMTREQSLTKINGKNVAKILIVVGSNARADHPKWRENLEFARKISAKMDSMYPGLSRGIAIKQGRYNQQYSTRAILIEVGSSKNSTEEAVEAGRLFGEVAVAVLNDLKK